MHKSYNLSLVPAGQAAFHLERGSILMGKLPFCFSQQISTVKQWAALAPKGNIHTYIYRHLLPSPPVSTSYTWHEAWHYGKIPSSTSRNTWKLNTRCLLPLSLGKKPPLHQREAQISDTVNTENPLSQPVPPIAENVTLALQSLIFSHAGIEPSCDRPHQLNPCIILLGLASPACSSHICLQKSLSLGRNRREGQWTWIFLPAAISLKAN